jgi:hypothetical protein
MANSDGVVIIFDFAGTITNLRESSPEALVITRDLRFF